MFLLCELRQDVWPCAGLLFSTEQGETTHTLREGTAARIERQFLNQVQMR